MATRVSLCPFCPVWSAYKYGVAVAIYVCLVVWTAEVCVFKSVCSKNVQHCTCFDLKCSSMTDGLKPFNRTLRLVNCNKTPWNDTGLFITVFRSSAGGQKTTVVWRKIIWGKENSWFVKSEIENEKSLPIYLKIKFCHNWHNPCVFPNIFSSSVNHKSTIIMYVAAVGQNWSQYDFMK